MTWREFIEKYEGNKTILMVVNEEFAKKDGASYDDEMPTWTQHHAIYMGWKSRQL